MNDLLSKMQQGSDHDLAMAASSLDQVSFERYHSHVPVEIIALLPGKDLMVGVIEVASDVVETPEQIAHTIDEVLAFADKERVLLSTNCGMAPMDRQVASRKLHALNAGAALARERLA